MGNGLGGGGSPPEDYITQCLFDDFVLTILSTSAYAAVFMLRDAYNNYEHRSFASGERRGFDREQQKIRRDQTTWMLYDTPYGEFKDRKLQLRKTLSIALAEPIRYFKSLGVKTPMSEASQLAVVQHIKPDHFGSQPSVRPATSSSAFVPRIPAPNYKDILADMHLIFLPPGHTGRKAGTSVKELGLQVSEMSMTSSEWVSWWLGAGGFEAPFVIDKCILAILDILEDIIFLNICNII